MAALKGGAEVEVARTENFHLGACELRILVGENLPKRVAVLRNGMLITEGLPGLKRFSDPTAGMPEGPRFASLRSGCARC